MVTQRNSVLKIKAIHTYINRERQRQKQRDRDRETKTEKQRKRQRETETERDIEREVTRHWPLCFLSWTTVLSSMLSTLPRCGLSNPTHTLILPWSHLAP